MKILLVHLSDLHISAKGDPLFLRRSAIVDALKNLEYELEAVLIIVSGDIANTGAEEEYVLALQFLQDLSTDLAGAITRSHGGATPPVHVITVPGNHDCDLTGPQGARSSLLEDVLRRPSLIDDASVLKICLDVQAAYFEMQDAVERTQAEELPPSARLYRKIQLEFSGRLVVVHCFNTAWMSQVHEGQGKLSFPSHLVEADSAKAALVIAVWHHPYNWLESSNARDFRRRIESIADIVLTGHEHDPCIRNQEGLGGERNAYVEGGVLQDRNDPVSSSFNAFVFDIEASKQKLSVFRLDNGTYLPANSATAGREGFGLEWRDYHLNRARQVGSFLLKDSFQQALDDPGAHLTHQYRGPLKLSDIFVFPDLRQVDYLNPENHARISGEDVPAYVVEHPLLFVSGDTQSGKTSLAKMLFADLRRQEIIPVLLGGSRTVPADDRLFGMIEDAFSVQYDIGDLHAYRQLDRSRRAIIVDDIHGLGHGRDRLIEIVRRLKLFADRILIFCNDYAINVGDVQGPLEALGFMTLNILPFGFRRRDELAQKWIALGPVAEQDAESVAHELHRVGETLATLIGRNFVPSFPIVILAVLQAYDAGTSIDLRASTQGYFYELLIRNRMQRGRNSKQYDLVAAYLSFVAHEMFVSQAWEIPESRLLRIHDEYQAAYAIRLDFSQVSRDLIAQEIWAVSGDLYRFKYSYLYYYFVALYVRDHLSDSQIQAEIAAACDRLYIDEFANVLLFLAHLTKDPYVTDQMVRAAAGIFASKKPEELQADPLAILTSEPPTAQHKVVYDEAVEATARHEMLAARDEKSEEDDRVARWGRDTVVDTQDTGLQLAQAFKAIGVMGQILKNFPGSLGAGVKEKLVASCYDLGMRALRGYLDVFQEHRAEAREAFEALVKARRPDLGLEEARRLADQTLEGMIRLGCFGSIRSVAQAVGSQELRETYAAVLRERPVPSVKLIDVAISLDHDGRFPEGLVADLARDLKDPGVPKWILQCLMIEHFYCFPVSVKIKQRMCEALDVPFKSVQGRGSATRLIR